MIEPTQIPLLTEAALHAPKEPDHLHKPTQPPIEFLTLYNVYIWYLNTGTTPQRQTFTYPKNLSITDPHDELLQRFRNEVLVGDAPNVPLPDDTIEVGCKS